MIANCSNTTVYVGVTIFAWCGPVEACTEQYIFVPPPMLINWWPSWFTTQTFFWTDDENSLVR